jgi:transcriptional regulator with XRE-family HTH domain
VTSTSKKATFGERLRQARLAAGLSHRNLAIACGLKNHSMIGHWESGTTEPGFALTEVLAAALGVSACWLAFGEEYGAKPENAEIEHQETQQAWVSR